MVVSAAPKTGTAAKARRDARQAAGFIVQLVGLHGSAGESLLYDDETRMGIKRRRCETGHTATTSRLMLAYLVCALLSSSASATWPFTPKRFKNSLIDSGSLGIDGNGRIIAFGDFNSDQLSV